MSRYDLVIKNAEIIDGSGKKPYRGDIGIKDRKIVEIGEIEPDGSEVIDASGLLACPGFIDTHTHTDVSFMDCPAADNFLMQGVTTVVGGHCGVSAAPVLDKGFYNNYMKALIGAGFTCEWQSFGEWLEYLDKLCIGINYVPLVGLNLLRAGVLGEKYQRASTDEEILQIRGELEKALEEGAFGMSASFDAATAGHHADEREILVLLALLRDRNAVFAPHTRHHQNQIPSDDGVETAYGLFIGEKGEVITGRYHGFVEILEYAQKVDGINIMLSHITPSYIIPQPHPLYVDEAIARATLEEFIDKPRERGINISFNMISSDASIGSEQYITDSFFSKSFKVGIPQYIKELGPEGLAEKLASREFRAEIKNLINKGRLKPGMLSAATDPYWSQCFMVTSGAGEEYLDKTLFEIASEKYPGSRTHILYTGAVEALCDIIQSYPRAKWAMITDKREANVIPFFLKHPLGMPCSDSAAFDANPGEHVNYLGYGASPTAYSLMPTYLVKLVKTGKVLTIEEAIRKVTSLPAQILGIGDRGLIRKGYWADIALVNWNNLKVYHDYRNPQNSAEGIEYTIVNGSVAYTGKKATGKRTGMVLRKM